MPNGTYGGVRGKETKAGQKTFVSRPTRLFILSQLFFISSFAVATATPSTATFFCAVSPSHAVFINQTTALSGKALSVAPCGQLTLDSRGGVMFGHAYSVSENIHTLFRASLQPLSVILTALYFLKVTVAIINSNGNIKD